MKVARRTYADLYGPTAGDNVRLGDTALLRRHEHVFNHLALVGRRHGARRRLRI